MTTPHPSTPLEEAATFADLRRQGLSIRDIARRYGRSSREVRDRLVLGRLPAEAAAERARATDTDQDRHAPTRFTTTHPLAERVRGVCTHRDSRQMVADVGCGQCWEQTITDDATGAQS